MKTVTTREFALGQQTLTVDSWMNPKPLFRSKFHTVDKKLKKQVDAMVPRTTTGRTAIDTMGYKEAVRYTTPLSRIPTAQSTAMKPRPQSGGSNLQPRSQFTRRPSSSNQRAKPRLLSAKGRERPFSGQPANRIA